MPAKSAANIRRTFNIKGHQWRVVYVWNLAHPEHGPCLGLCDSENKTIFIENHQSPESKRRTFFHELFHAIAFECHATEAGGVEGFLGEVLAEGATDVMLSLFDIEWKGARARKPKPKLKLKVPKLTVDQVENV